MPDAMYRWTPPFQLSHSLQFLMVRRVVFDSSVVWFVEWDVFVVVESGDVFCEFGFSGFADVCGC